MSSHSTQTRKRPSDSQSTGCHFSPPISLRHTTAGADSMLTKNYFNVTIWTQHPAKGGTHGAWARHPTLAHSISQLMIAGSEMKTLSAWIDYTIFIGDWTFLHPGNSFYWCHRTRLTLDLLTMNQNVSRGCWRLWPPLCSTYCPCHKHTHRHKHVWKRALV